MSTFAKAAIGAVAVIAVLGGLIYLGGSQAPSVGGGVLGSPSPTPTSSATPTTSPSPAPTLTTYHSDRYGFDVGRPAGWGVRSAERNWTFQADAADPLSPAFEDFISPDGHTRVSAWSIASPGTEMPNSGGADQWRNLETWVQTYCERTNDTPCTDIHARAVPFCLETMDCHPALLVPFDTDVQAFFTLGGDPVTVLAVWRADSDPNAAQYGGSRKLLEAFLSTMGVVPADASRYGPNRDAAAEYVASP